MTPPNAAELTAEEQRAAMNAWDCAAGGPCATMPNAIFRVFLAGKRAQSAADAVLAAQQAEIAELKLELIPPTPHSVIIERARAEIAALKADAERLQTLINAEELTVKRIECVAVRHPRGLIFSLPRPARHHDVLHAMHELGLSTLRQDAEQGFLLTDGEFAWRTKAKTIALESGQHLVNGMEHRKDLFSEDLW